MIHRRLFLAGLTAAGLAPPAQAAPEAQRAPVELFEEALELEAAIRVGAAQGDVTLVEFFDYNCPWCKRSAADLPGLLKQDPDLTYVLVNYAVLGQPSVEATRVALAFFDLYGPERYLALHQRLFALRGPVDGARAVREAEALGAPAKRLVAIADSPKITRQMTEAVRVGGSLGLVATPSFVIGPEVYGGHLSLDDKRAIIARARA